ncbi:MAG: hypothetical protein K2Y15_05905 [Burkholderiaceae bacterium]|nr:hypothetical protein [Burkholderiaceae bacterium]
MSAQIHAGRAIGESVMYAYPDIRYVRRAYEWKPEPQELKGPSLARIAQHEAGHIVLMEWVGFTGMVAEVSETAGSVNFPGRWQDLPEPSEDSTGELSATAAAVFHAGLAAELLYFDLPWTGPVLRLEHSDHQLAEKMLSRSFGCHSSGAHAYAQRIALHVIQASWERCSEIAKQLMERRVWGQKA